MFTFDEFALQVDKVQRQAAVNQDAERLSQRGNLPEDTFVNLEDAINSKQRCQ